MDIRLLSRKYAVRKLNINDVDIIYDMSCKNEIFYKYHPPFVTKESIIEDMEALHLTRTMKISITLAFLRTIHW